MCISLRSLNLLLAVVLASTLITAQIYCKNPNDHWGQCVSMYNCSTLIDVIKKHNLSEEEQKFIVKSECLYGVGKKPYVCCTSDQNFVTTSIEDNPRLIWSKRKVKTLSEIRGGQPKSRTNNEPGNLLPKPPDCGPVTLANRIYSGNQTELDEYPWMVLLEYLDNDGKISLNCGGSLINQRYVLTAGHCVRGAIETEVGRLIKVRLGEYDISSEIDCIDDDCNDKVIRADIEETVPHYGYDTSSIDRHHDIALIRLSDNIKYTDFIRPVCLPLPSLEPETVNIGDQLIVAGWGRTLIARQSNVKMQLAVPVQDLEYCAGKFRTRQVRLVSTQMCAGGEFAKDSCDGDSGGPLMRLSPQKRWFIEGVVSFGNRCGLQGWPGVYTNVRSYIDWIQSTLKP